MIPFFVSVSHPRKAKMPLERIGWGLQIVEVKENGGLRIGRSEEMKEKEHG